METYKDELTILAKNTLRSAIGEEIDDYEITLLDYLPYTKKYTACIKLKYANNVHILHSKDKSSLSAVADDFISRFLGIAFCYAQGRQARIMKKIEEYYI